MNNRHLDEVVPLGQPPLRQWEVNENTTRYERLQAAPSDHDLVLMWSLWMAINVVVAVIVALVLFSILLHRKARSNPFNIFLVFLMVPDFLFSACCALSCLLNALVGHYWSAAMCQFQAFYVVLGIAANNWLNLAVGWELHSLLSSSRVFRKYTLPSNQRVVFISLSVYAYSCFLASWALWADRFDNFPHRIVTISGMGCLPLEYSRESSIFWYVVYFPLMTGIPFFAVLGMGFHIWYHSLMPPSGRRRTLAIFFGPIIAIFAIMWLPYFALGLSGAGRPWLVFAGGAVGHCQGAVSALITLTKPDVRQAFCRLIRCRFGKTEALPVSSSGFSFVPTSKGTREVSRDRRECPRDLTSPRSITPPLNEYYGRSEKARNEIGVTDEGDVEESDELGCWPDE